MVPMVLFVSKLQTLKLLLHERISKRFTLTKLGELWWCTSNCDMLANVRAFITRHSIETHILSMLSSAVSTAGATFKHASELQPSWQPAEAFCTRTISANFIQTAATIDAESTEILEFLAAIRDQQLFDLESALRRFQQTLFSSELSNSHAVALPFQLELQALQLQNIVAVQLAMHLLQHLLRLVNGNYAVQLDNLLAGLIIANQTVILTHSVLAGEKRTNYNLRCKMPHELAYGEPIQSIDRRYVPERQLKLVPQISERRRWMYSGIARVLTIVAPCDFARQLATSLSKALFFLKLLLQTAQLVDVD